MIVCVASSTGPPKPMPTPLNCRRDHAGLLQQLRDGRDDLPADAVGAGSDIDRAAPQAREHAVAGPTPSCSLVPPISMPR